MHKKNLFVTFPVDAGMKASEKYYQNIFSEDFDFESFSYKSNTNDTYNEYIRKKRYRFLASFKLRNKIKKYSQKRKLIIFHGLSPMIYTYGSYNFTNTILSLDATRFLPDFVLKNKPQKDLAYHVHKFILKRVSKILCWTDPVVEMVNTFYNIPYKKIFKVPAPFQASTFKMLPRETPKKPKVLFIGREFDRKGGDIIIKKLDKFLNNCSLTMVTGDKRANIKNIKYFDAKLNRDQIIDLYRTHDILLLPTKFDPYGLVLAEAAAAGLAIVTTKSALGSKDTITNNVTGFIAETQEECVDLTIELTKDHKKIDAFKAAAYSKIEHSLTEAKIYEKYMKYINN